LGQTKLAAIMTTQDEQTNEHDQKQDHVANYSGDETKCAGLGLDSLTGKLVRDPSRAKLRMG
jgi:hypothetical protein